MKDYSEENNKLYIELTNFLKKSVDVTVKVLEYKSLYNKFYFEKVKFLKNENS